MTLVAKTPACSIEQLRARLKYDAQTGKLTWLACNRRDMIGSEAGTIEAKGYRVVKVIGRSYKASRIAWAMHYGQWPPEDRIVDHRDRDRTNNAIDNLRLATCAENSQNNGGSYKRTGEGLKGAYPHRGGWRAMISIRGRLTRLGQFGTEREAHQAYLAAALREYGAFGMGAA